MRNAVTSNISPDYANLEEGRIFKYANGSSYYMKTSFEGKKLLLQLETGKLFEPTPRNTQPEISVVPVGGVVNIRVGEG